MPVSGRWLAVLIGGACALAAFMMIGLDRGLQSHIEDRARERLVAEAGASLGLAETRLDQVATILADLAAAGVGDCGPRSLLAMRRAVFTQTALKGLAVLDPQGRVHCTHIGPVEELPINSREHSVAQRAMALSVARFRHDGGRAVRLRLDRENERSLAALIAADVLLPDLNAALEGGSRRLRLMLESGELIATYPEGDEGAGFDDGRSLVARRVSDRFPILLTAERSRGTLAQEYRDLQFIVRFGGLLLVLSAAAMFWLVLRRRRDDPAAALRRAIGSGEIVPFYQPIVNTQTGRIVGAEVLARWRLGDGTLIPPNQFIPLAEQTGLIFDLTVALMQRARTELGPAYRARPRLRVAFNLFAGHFQKARIVKDVRTVFEGSDISFNQIVLEVTERAPVDDLGEARRTIAELQALGAKVAIDDVGTGHGGLSYLLKLGVDIIKIDKMFIDAIDTERYSQTIIETLIELARTMNMELIAEGVETFEQVEYVRRKAITGAQGYIFAPPLPGSSYLALVEAMERPALSVVENGRASLGAA